MLNISAQEVLLILLIALLVVGPRRLPELGRSLGKGIRELRKAQDEVRKTIQVNLEDERPTYPRSKGAAQTEEASSSGANDLSETSSQGASDVSEVSKTLGRSLAELRRAREEIQRSFRVDVDDVRAPRPPAAPKRAKPPPSASRNAARDVDAPGDGAGEALGDSASD